MTAVTPEIGEDADTVLDWLQMAEAQPLVGIGGVLRHPPICQTELDAIRRLAAPPPATGEDDPEKALEDAKNYGVGFIIDGIRVSPERVTICRGEEPPTTDEVVGVLRPFARFVSVLETMGGNSPKSGPFYGVSSASMGEAELTVEDFQRARSLLAKLEKPHDH